MADQLNEGQQIKAPFLPASVGMKSFNPRASYYKLEVVPQDSSNRFISRNLNADQLAQIQVIQENILQEVQDAEDFYLFIEANRIRLANQFDPQLVAALGNTDDSIRCLIDSGLKILRARLVVTGGDSHRLHEQIITAGGRIYQGRFRRLNVGQRKELLEAALDTPVSERTEERLVKLWPAVKPALERSLDARVEERTAGIERLLREREEKETADIEAILTELAQTIEMELSAPEYRQLELFTDNELNQLTRNTQALQARLERIPVEIEAEQEAIRARFADPQPRLFPVAITFLIPERFA